MASFLRLIRRRIAGHKLNRRTINTYRASKAFRSQNSGLKRYTASIPSSARGGTTSSTASLAPPTSTGLSGSQGPPGPAGAPGAQGIQGPPGIPGAAGSAGPAGSAGAAGPTGSQGSAGATGADGANGSDGDDGADGTSVTIQGTVANLAAMNAIIGMSAGEGWFVDGDGNGNLHVYNGTAFEDVGNITGPQGDAGAEGAQGSQGSQGSQGAQGSTGAQGPAGPGVDWSVQYDLQKRNVAGVCSTIGYSGNYVAGSGWFENTGAEKYIITNVHNIAENNSGASGPYLAGLISVSWMDPNGDIRTENAEIQKYFPKLDVAMLKIGNNAGLNMPITTILGDNRAPNLEGQEAMTIGHPYGKFNYKLTNGLIGDARCDDGSWMSEAVVVDYETFGGNSGGPIFNSSGEVIGMHTWAYEIQEGSCANGGDSWDEESCKDQNGTWSLTGDRAEQFAGGIGAFPMKGLIAAWIADIAANPGNIGSLGDWSGEWGAIGIQYENMNTSKLMQLMNSTPAIPPDFGLKGCFVTKTWPSGPALTAGILEGDIILAIDGVPVGPGHTPLTSSLAMEVGLKGHTASVTIDYATWASGYATTASATFNTDKMINISKWIRTSWI